MDLLAKVRRRLIPFLFAGALLSMYSAGGLAGSRWLFLLEGPPAIVAGVVVLRYFADRPADAAWLSDADRVEHAARLQDNAREQRQPTTVSALTNARTWLLAPVYFTITVANYGIGFWLPQMLKTASGASNVIVGLLAAIPHTAAAIAMVLVGRCSDRTSERRRYIAACAVVAAATLASGGPLALWAGDGA